MKKLTLFILIALLSLSTFSQKKIDFDSKYLFTTEELGVDIKILTDSVVFKHDNSIMYCDSALFNYGKSYFDAFGNIKIIKPPKGDETDTVFLYGDTLHYSGKIKQAKVRNNVILKKDSLTLLTDSLDYDLNKNVGHYFNNGTTINGEDTLTSVFGYYYADVDEFFFKKNVVVRNPRFKMYSDTLKHNTVEKITYFIGPTEIISDSNYIYCENGWYNHNKNVSQFNKNAFLRSKEQILRGDSLFYDRNSGIGKAYNNVVFEDTIQNVMLLGHDGLYLEKNGYAMMTDSALFIQAGETDSLYMHADTLESYKDSILLNEKYEVYRIIRAFKHVKTFKTDFQSKCDSLVYNLKDSVIEMHINPVMWSDSNQLSADYIEILTKKNEIDRVDLKNKAFIISQSDSIRFDQIYGKNMIAYVDDRKLSQIDVIENGKSIYFIRDDLKRLIGVNFIECADMEIYMKNSTVDKIWFFEKPVGKIHPPLTLSIEKTILPDFKWDIEYRPTKKEDIFIWKKEIQKQSFSSEKKEDEKNRKNAKKNIDNQRDSSSEDKKKERL